VAFVRVIYALQYIIIINRISSRDNDKKICDDVFSTYPIIYYMTAATANTNVIFGFTDISNREMTDL
jgi:hypothetical protein